MAKGAAPSTDQLLELLKRAADEIKHAQEEARTAVAALAKEQAAHAKTEKLLDAAREAAKSAPPQPSSDDGLLKDQIEAERENSKTLTGRIKELEAGVIQLQTAEREIAKAHEARIKEMEAGLERAISERETLRETLKSKMTETDTAISISQQQEEAKRALQQQNHESELKVLAQEHANALQAAELELQRALEAAEATREELEAAHQRSMTAVADRHAEMQAEHAQALEAAAAERAELEAGQRSMLDDAAGKLVAMESQLVAERDKHQIMAQKVIETRGKVRDLEAAFMQEQERVRGLEQAAGQMADAHQKAMREGDAQHAAATANLEAAAAQARDELQRTTESWQQVERQYEALHREMLMTLEQRDDARRNLESEKTERERLQRALQGQGHR